MQTHSVTHLLNNLLLLGKLLPHAGVFPPQRLVLPLEVDEFGAHGIVVVLEVTQVNQQLVDGLAFLHHYRAARGDLGKRHAISGDDPSPLLLLL